MPKSNPNPHNKFEPITATHISDLNTPQPHHKSESHTYTHTHVSKSKIKIQTHSHKSELRTHKIEREKTILIAQVLLFARVSVMKMSFFAPEVRSTNGRKGADANGLVVPLPAERDLLASFLSGTELPCRSKEPPICRKQKDPSHQKTHKHRKPKPKPKNPQIKNQNHKNEVWVFVSGYKFMHV